ncbi:MAG: hypothetical protein QM820_04305 [Minicystis sp.]
MLHARRSALFATILLSPVIAAASCGGGGNGDTSTPTGTGGSSGASSTASSGSGTGAAGGGLFTGSSSSGGPVGPFNDFPKDPIVDPSAPANAGTLFGPAGSGDPSGGPCVFEPEPDTLFPSNWLRPRFRYSPAAGQNLFEIRLHTTAETDDLVVYTANPSWTMPKDMWTALTTHAADVPITMTVRGAQFDGQALVGQPALGSSWNFTIAPADAAGAIVYWTTSGGSALKGFQAGDESVALALQPAQVKMPTVKGDPVSCVGCHTSTPDGKYAGFTAQGPWGNALASVEAATVGAQPPFMGAGALATLAQFGELGIQTYSKAHWSDGDHVMIAPFGPSPGAQLAWFDLEAAQSGQGMSYGFLARNGDTRDVGAPTFSHDGKTVVYVSTDVEFTGRLDNGFADLYSVPYNNRQGGAATPVPGASDPALEEYYPAFSPDDAWLAFNRIPNGNNMYNQPLGEVFVIPAAGGTATRLAANDPPMCTGKTSPGVTNSWPKWAPERVNVGSRTFYWIIFSSTRGPQNRPQLYISGVVVNGGNVETHGALYLWNQPEDENNHTPAWDIFKIPSPPPQ